MDKKKASELLVNIASMIIFFTFLTFSSNSLGYIQITDINSFIPFFRYIGIFSTLWAIVCLVEYKIIGHLGITLLYDESGRPLQSTIRNMGSNIVAWLFVSFIIYSLIGYPASVAALCAAIVAYATIPLYQALYYLEKKRYDYEQPSA